MGIVIPIEQLEGLGRTLRRQQRRVVFTSGHRDSLQVGNLRYLHCLSTRFESIGWLDKLPSSLNDLMLRRSEQATHPLRPINVRYVAAAGVHDDPRPLSPMCD